MGQESNGDTSSGKDCAYCGSTIATKALVCPTCRNYQDKWRNRLIFIGGLGGGMSLIAGFLAIAAHHGVETYRSLYWRDAYNVLEFEAGAYDDVRAIVSNRGDGPVLASTFVLHWGTGSFSYPINQSLPANELREVRSVAWDRREEKPADLYVTNATGAATPGIMYDALPMDRQKCIYPVHFSENHPSLPRFREFFKTHGQGTLVESPLRVVAHYYSVHSGARNQIEFSGSVLFRKRATAECRDFKID